MRQPKPSWLQKWGLIIRVRLTFCNFNTVGPSIGQEVTQGAALAVAAAAVFILGYITFAFRGIPHAFSLGPPQLSPCCTM